ncbi:MAG: tol-pal system-associated acyl-CoA thioesterase [Alphaproteobacteria bacterium]|nr:tol-pal system-associated acyl-CoA thioesterase [Alphaproteobacteria bacterium]
MKTKTRKQISSKECPDAFTATLPIRIYYEDTDAGGVVYYANYLKFAERGRTELLRQLKVDHQQLLEDHRLLFVVKLFNIEYQAPARLDDLIHVDTSITSIGGASLDMKQVIRRKDKILTLSTAKLVTITPSGQVLRLPDPLRKIFSDCLK